MKALLRRLHAPVYEKRLEVLCDLLGPHLSSGESLLDVGCGSGQLAARLEELRGVKAEGLEVRPRPDCPIPVTAYAGSAFPFADRSIDTVLLADILHHEEEPEQVLREAARVARKRVIVKDHKIAGPLAQPRVAFIDWAANAGYDVPCLYRYCSAAEWSALFRRCGLVEERVLESLDLYPPILNMLFGKRLQYLAVVRPVTASTTE